MRDCPIELCHSTNHAAAIDTGENGEWHAAQAAVEKLEEAKAAEDAMAYMEPPRLWQPIRHCLGFTHLNFTGNHKAAEQACLTSLDSVMLVITGGQATLESHHCDSGWRAACNGCCSG